MTDYIDFWTLYEKGREYGFKDPVYYGGWHRGQDIPGANKTVPWLNKDVPLLHPGLQPYWKGQQPKLGGVFVYKVGNEFWAYCHVRPTGTGFRISSWDDPIEWRGTSWAGPHVHLVRSKTWDAAWNTNRAVLDPRPVIRTKLAEAEKKEDDMTPQESKMLADLHHMFYNAPGAKRLKGFLQREIDILYDAVRVADKDRGDGRLTTMVRDIQRKVGAIDTGSMTDAQVSELAEELKTTLSPAIVNALGQQLLKK